MAAAPETQFHQLQPKKTAICSFCFYREIHVWPQQAIVIATGRASLSGRCQQAVAQADMCHQTKQTGADPTLLQCHWIVIDLDRSVIGPGSTVTRKASQRESPLKRLHELCETCHSKAVFHYTAVKYLRRFLILALQLDRNAPF